jgi:hypothetical protein
MNAKILWKDRTDNRKTGDVPTAFVGATRQESFESCAGCPLREKDCYSQRGIVAMSHNSMLKKNARVGDSVYSLSYALANRSVSARYVRFTAIGDGARCNPEEVKAAHAEVKKAGLGWLAYTHFPEEVMAQGMQDYYCASKSTMEEADEVLEKGFKRATITARWDLYDEGKRAYVSPAGNKAVICPALMAHSKGHRVTCNQCGLCDPSKAGPKIIIFPDHGPGIKSKIKKLADKGIEWAMNLAKPL